MNIVGTTNDAWPMIDGLWDFYSDKSVKTVFISVGSGQSALADIHIAETLGCPVHIWDLSGSPSTPLWNEVRAILKERKRPETASDFTEGVDAKWVLPKNVRSYVGIPSFSTIPGVHVSFNDCVQRCIDSMKLTEPRIDLLKITLANGAERHVLLALLDTSYRPGLILVQWSEMPDNHLFTTLTAGHLQNCGYALLAKRDNHFLYVYNDKCMYEYCSWETNKVPNPLVNEIVKYSNSRL